MPADMTALLDDLRAEHSDLDALVDGVDLDADSAAAGWTIRDCVGHLWYFDREATRALVDPDAKLVDRDISIHGTGHPLPNDPGTYIGTFQLQGGAFVFHAFDHGEA